MHNGSSPQVAVGEQRMCAPDGSAIVRVMTEQATTINANRGGAA
jgi:hypothetical protein